MKHIEQLLEFLTRMNRSASASTASCLESRSSSPFERMYGGISSESHEDEESVDQEREASRNLLCLKLED